MKDILGRELQDGDMCIGMAIGRYSHGMRIGVFKGASVVYLGTNESYIDKSHTSNTYLIENPTEKELEIKYKINTFLQQEEEERKKKASVKTIPLNRLEIGGIYKDVNGRIYVYLGKRKVTLEDFYRDNKEEKEGQCFVYIYSIDNKTDDGIRDEILTIDTYRRTHSVDVLKGNKRLVELIRKVDLEFPLVKIAKNAEGWYGMPDDFKLTIE